jgi:linearmycin/streptolysin S transport system permease protein
MHGVVTIAGKDLRQRLRDRSALVLVLVAPLAIASIMSFAFRDVSRVHFTFGIVAEDHGAAALSLQRAFDAPSLKGLVTVSRVATIPRAIGDVRTHRLEAALVIPKGYGASLLGSAPLALRTLTSVNYPAAAGTMRAIVSGFAAQVDADRLSVATALAAGAPASSLAQLEQAVARARLPVRDAVVPAGAEQLTAISYYAPAMALFFVLFAISFTARSYFVDRATGMVDRMRVAPLSARQIVGGKALGAFVLAFASLIVVAAVTSAAFGASWGGPLAVGVLALAMALAVACLTGLVIVVSRTQRQAEAIGSAVVFALALLGGNFVQLSTMSPLMRSMSLLTPNGWAMRGFTDLSTLGGGIDRVATPILAILGLCAGMGAVVALLARRAVER